MYELIQSQSSDNYSDRYDDYRHESELLLIDSSQNTHCWKCWTLTYIIWILFVISRSKKFFFLNFFFSKNILS